MHRMGARDARTFTLAVGTLAGTIIGAGMFSLPFVVRAAGFVPGFFFLFLAVLVYAVLHLMYADLFLMTSGEHRFVGYASRYLGKGGVPLAVGMSVIQTILVMTIYLVLAARFAPLAGAPALPGVVAFWLLGSLAIFFDLKRITLAESLATAAIVAIVAFLFGIGIPSFSTFSLNAFPAGIGTLLLPLAPLLFSLGGRVAIPSLVREIGGAHPASAAPRVRKAILAGTVIPAIVYVAFIVAVLALTPTPSEDAVGGLLAVLPAGVRVALGILGLLALWSSYFIIGVDVESILRHDLRLPRPIRLLAVVALPLALYAFSSEHFIGLVSLVGGIFLSLEGILIIRMWQQARREHSAANTLLPKLGSVAVRAVTLTLLAALVSELASVFF